MLNHLERAERVLMTQRSIRIVRKKKDNQPVFDPECRPSVSMPFAPQKSDNSPATTVMGTAAFCRSSGWLCCHQPQKANGRARIRT